MMIMCGVVYVSCSVVHQLLLSSGQFVEDKDSYGVKLSVWIFSVLQEFSTHRVNCALTSYCTEPAAEQRCFLIYRTSSEQRPTTTTTTPSAENWPLLLPLTRKALSW